MTPVKPELPEALVELCRKVGLDPEAVEEVLSSPEEGSSQAWVVRVADTAVGMAKLDEQRYARIMANRVERYETYDQALDADLPQMTTSMKVGKQYRMVAYDAANKPLYQVPVQAHQVGMLDRCVVVRLKDEDVENLTLEFVAELKAAVNRGRKDQVPVIVLSGDCEFIKLVEHVE